MKGIRYYDPDEVIPRPWSIQGTVYPKLEDARQAAMTLSCISTGVRVKRVVDGWTLLFWRRNTVAA